MREPAQFGLGELVGPLLIVMLTGAVIATFVTAIVLTRGGVKGEVVAEVSPTATPTGPPAGGGLTIAMVPTIKFDTADLTAKAGVQVAVRFDNRDTGISHNWALYTDETAREAIAGANQNICTAPCTGEVAVPALAPGEYFFRCDVHPTQMVGKVVAE